MRTYPRAVWEEAQREWAEGEFGEEWRDARHAMAMRGWIHPPEGTQWDSWDDDQPSQRALLIRAIRETPQALMVAIGRSRNWSDAIAQVLAWRDDRHAVAARAELAGGCPTCGQAIGDYHEAVTSLRAIIERVGGS